MPKQSETHHLHTIQIIICKHTVYSNNMLGLSNIHVVTQKSRKRFDLNYRIYAGACLLLLIITYHHP